MGERASSAVRCSKQACCARADVDAGVLNEASGRWPVEVDADGANGAAVACQISVRPVNLVEREVSGGCMSFCNAPLPPRACSGAHCARTKACVAFRLQPMILLTRTTSDLGPFSSVALPAIVLQP